MYEDMDLDRENFNHRRFLITLRLIEEFYRKAKENDAIFVFVSLPVKGQKRVSQYSRGEDIPAYAFLSDRLNEYLKREHIRVIDIVPVFSGLPTSVYYFKNDGHMTKNGHELVATALFDTLSPDIMKRIKENLGL